MKRRLVLVPIALCLIASGCGGEARPSVAFPTLPPLSQEARTPCPDLPPVTGGYDDLIVKDAQLAIEYRKCEARRAAAVGAYEDAQRALREAEARANHTIKELP